MSPMGVVKGISWRWLGRLVLFSCCRAAARAWMSAEDMDVVASGVVVVGVAPVVVVGVAPVVELGAVLNSFTDLWALTAKTLN